MFPRSGEEFTPWKNASKVILSVLIVGILVRIVLMPFTSSPFDVAAGWVAVIDGFYSGDSVYSSGWLFYPPIWGYILSLIGVFADLIGMGSFGEVFTDIYDEKVLTIGHAMLTNPMFNVLVKIPAVIFDVLGGWTAYEIVKRLTRDQKKATIGFALWFLAPITIMSSAMLCMFDSIMMFLMMLSLLTFMDKRYFSSGCLMSLAILTKVFAILVVPVMIAYIISKRDINIRERTKNLLMLAIGAALMFVIVYLPALLSGEFMDSLWFFTGREDAYGGLTAPSFNNIFFYAPFYIVAYIAMFIYMALRKEDQENTFLWLYIISSALIFSMPMIASTPTYGITFLPSILILYALKGKIAMIPWALLIIFPIHGLFHYWETIFYPLAAFTGLWDISNVTEKIPFSLPYSISTWTMFLPGFVMILIVLDHMLKEKGVNVWNSIRRRSEQ